MTSSSATWAWLSLLSLGALAGVSACTEKDGDADDIVLPDEVTWHEHMAPIVQEKCSGCHLDDGIAPMELTSYASAAKFSKKLALAVEAGTMPPWGANDTDECKHPGEFKDDLRLSAYEKALFAAWDEQGAPEGDPKLAALLPKAPELTILEPDGSFPIPTGVTVEGSSDSFTCFRIDPGLTEDVWLTALQVVPGNSAIVHHALVFADPNDESAALADADGKYDCFGGPGTSNPTLLTAWAPGVVPLITPTDSGMTLRAGSKLVMQVHYHPTGEGPEVDDSTTIQFRWTKEQPSYVGGLLLIGNFGSEDTPIAGGKGFGLTTGPDFMIPAGATRHVEVNKFHVPDADFRLPLSLFTVGTHMHYVGTDMLITRSGDDGTQCLVHTPEWDFNWQRGYSFKGTVPELPAVYPGDDLTMRCTYNNSMSNRAVRDALADKGLTEPHDVVLGEETLDEMCLGVFGVMVPAAYGDEVGF